jgi:hypothetical protein
MDFRNDRRQFAGEAIGFGLRGGDGPAGPAALSIARLPGSAGISATASQSA